MTIKLADGRSELWQWDTGRKITFDDANIKQAHFQNHANGYGRTIDVDVEAGAAKIPDELLQAALPLTVYAYIGEESDGYTKVERVFTVKPRKRPAEYVFTPADQLTLRKLESMIGNLADLTTTAKNNLVAAINEAAKTGSGGAGSIDLRTADGYIQYSSDGGATWENLIALAELKGGKGDTGATGPQGAPGKDGSPGKDGADGAPGQDGFSPSASVAETATGATITITDKTGTTTAEIKNGKDGAPGKDGTNGKDGAPGAPGTPGTNGTDGKDGTTFTPSVSAAGDLSWTNDGGKANPAPVNIKGPQGAPGKDYTLTDADKTEIAAEAAAAIAGTSVPAPASAAVGQIVRIKAVDTEGKITETEAVDMPTGGRDAWELINHITIADDAEEAENLSINTDSNGKAFELKCFRFISYAPKYTGEAEILAYAYGTINGITNSAPDRVLPLVYTGIPVPSKTQDCTFSWSEGFLNGDGLWSAQLLKQSWTSESHWDQKISPISGNNALQFATAKNDPKYIYPITSVGLTGWKVYAGCEFYLYGVRIQGW